MLPNHDNDFEFESLKSFDTTERNAVQKRISKRLPLPRRHYHPTETTTTILDLAPLLRQVVDLRTARLDLQCYLLGLHGCHTRHT